MRGLTFSGQVLLSLTRKGVLRETAYTWVQRNAMKVWEGDQNFKDLILADSDIRNHLTEEEIDNIFNLEYQLRYLDAIYNRVFNRE